VRHLLQTALDSIGEYYYLLRKSSLSLEGPLTTPDNLDQQTISSEIILDVTDPRFKKVVATRTEYSVERVTTSRFIVRKGTSTYFVGLEKAKGKVLIASCNCPDWLYNSRKLMVPCKHIWLVAEAEGLVAFPSTDKAPFVEGDKDDGTDEDKKEDVVPLKDGKEKGTGDPKVEEIRIPRD
jgi:hypothetical protein